MKVQEAMNSHVVVVDAGESVQCAARKMKDETTGVLPVVENGQIVGILTDRDIVTRSVATGMPLAEVAVRTVMTDSVFGVPADAELETAAAVMKAKKIRRVLVAAGGRAAGILSLGDFAAHGDNPALAQEVLESVSYPAEPNRD